MAKSKVNFSIKLLELNRKHHKEQLKRKISPYAEKHMDKKMLKDLKKRQADHQRFYDDLTNAIQILKK